MENYGEIGKMLVNLYAFIFKSQPKWHPNP